MVEQILKLELLLVFKELCDLDDPHNFSQPEYSVEPRHPKETRPVFEGWWLRLYDGLIRQRGYDINSEEPRDVFYGNVLDIDLYGAILLLVGWYKTNYDVYKEHYVNPYV